MRTWFGHQDGSLRDEALDPRPGGAALHLRVLLRRDRLDEALARRARPGDDPAQRLRAAQLLQASERRRVARGLRSALASTEHPPVGWNARIPVAARAVRLGRPALERLASRLGSAAPVSARGVAQARLLLTDGTGPLYRDEDPDRLRDAALDALRALDPPAGQA